jgi:hypothetical protein
MLSRERFQRSVVGQFHDFGNFSLHNTLNFIMADAGQPLQRTSKANSKRLKGGVFGRIKPTHRLVHFNWRASRTATEMKLPGVIAAPATRSLRSRKWAAVICVPVCTFGSRNMRIAETVECPDRELPNGQID